MRRSDFSSLRAGFVSFVPSVPAYAGSDKISQGCWAVLACVLMSPIPVRRLVEVPGFALRFDFADVAFRAE